MNSAVCFTELSIQKNKSYSFTEGVVNEYIERSCEMY